MAKRTWWFLDLDVVESIDHAAVFGPLLTPHRAWCIANGLDPASLGADPVSGERLVEFFRAHRTTLPSALADVLTRIGDLATEYAHDRARERAAFSGIDLQAELPRASPAMLAAHLYVHHKSFFDSMHQLVGTNEVRRFAEFRGPAAKGFRLPDDARARIEARLAGWFDKRGRTRFVEVHPESDGRHIIVEIEHGRPPRTEPSLTEALQRSRTGLLPRATDRVVLSPGAGLLRVRGCYPGEKQMYREVIGEELFGSRTYFDPREAVYTLDPLATRGRAALAPGGIAGLEYVILRSVVLHRGDPLDRRDEVMSNDLFASIEVDSDPDLSRGQITGATLLFKFADRPRPLRVEVQPPYSVHFDRRRYGKAVETFLLHQGFCLVSDLPSPMEQANDTVLRASGT